MKKLINARAALMAYPLSALSIAISAVTYAQDAKPEPEQAPVETTEQQTKNKPIIANPLEEMLILGRQKSAAGDIVLERMEQEVAVDLIGAEQISRVGDSNVAAALRRVPGVTLVDDKFVFVRGLGERYSSTLLNGAVVPSPDLTRNVIPLDIFPTSIVENLAVQKMASADMPAAFGGGSVDIRTKGIPSEFLLTLEASTGGNTVSGDFISYNGGGDDFWGDDDGTRGLSSELRNAAYQYHSNLTPENIAQIEGISTEAATDINQELAQELYRDLNIYHENGSPDTGFAVNVGNNFLAPKGMEFGFLAGVSYDSSWRNKESRYQYSNDVLPGTDILQDVSFRKETTYNVSLTGNLTLGLRLNEENTIETTSIFIRNTDDKTSFEDYFDGDAPITGTSSDRKYNYRYEQREMIVNQIHGEHELGFDTLEALGLNSFKLLEGIKFNWYLSDSVSTTDIPNEVSIDGGATWTNSPYTLEAASSSVDPGDSSANFKFTELEDHVDSNGFELSAPIYLTDFEIEISAGSEYWQKARIYEQFVYGLGSTETAGLAGLPGNVFSDNRIANDEYEFEVKVDSNSVRDSYIASSKVSAAFGKFDVTWNETIRLSGGLRWEDYQQVGLGWDPLDFDGSSIIPDGIEDNATAVGEYFESATFTDTDTFGSLALTYMRSDDFQLRAGFSETTVRPELRDITNSNYIDPLTDFQVFGNPDLIPAAFKNYDLRAEWFWVSGDNLAVSLFHKDIQNPIEVIETLRSEDDRAMTIFNADEATLTGLEVEFLKSLGEISESLEPFFIQGNVTILDNSVTIKNNPIPQGVSPTDDERNLIGASDAVNLIIGYDSDDGKHSATVSYNWFGDRIFFGGSNTRRNVIEKAAGTLDATYSFYPTENVTVKVKAKNILDESSRFIRDGEDSITTLEKELGSSWSLGVKYEF